MSTDQQQTTMDEYALLTEREREAYKAVEELGFGVREMARHWDVSPGTVGNLLRRARRKLDEVDQ